MSGDSNMTSSRSCLNCGAALSTPYCSQCGQKAATHRISLTYLLHEIPHAIFHVDRGLIPTLVGLFRRPGVVVAEYLDGKRARYFNPLTLLVLCSSLCAAMWLIFPFKPQVFWAGHVLATDARFNQFITLWFKIVGFSQLLWLPLMGWWLRVTHRGAHLYRLQQQIIADKLRALDAPPPGSIANAGGDAATETVAPVAPPPPRHKIKRSLLITWIRLTGTIRASRTAYVAMKRSGDVRNYGECIVVAAFMTSASLLISGALSPILYTIDMPLYYRLGMAFTAMAACIPVYALLTTSPMPVRPTIAGALIASGYFVIGTPYGFLLVTWLLQS
jgi:hypothetical protein